jgi:DNA-binding protein HU-beta
MKNTAAVSLPELDLETDDLLIEIALTAEEVDPALLRAIIPSRKIYLEYLEQHKLNDYPIAQEILAQFEALESSAKIKKRKYHRRSIQDLMKSSLTKTALTRQMAEKLELSNKQSAAFLDLLAETAIKETRRSGLFVIPGIGRLVKTERKARLGRHPQTGEAIKIAAKSVVRFRVAKSAKNAIAAKKD